MSWTKKISFSLIALATSLVILEIFSYALLSTQGKLNQEVFVVTDYTEYVDDSRFYTMKKSFEGIDGSACNMIVQTNEFGFRVPPALKNERSGTALFIGDSVPFGYCVDAKDSIPFKFSNLQKDLSTINGAIPSYSLSQTVQRLRLEFEGLENVKVIFLQIYEPAASYATMGNEWSVEDNWLNANKRRSELCNFFPVEHIMFKTYFGMLVNIIDRRLFTCGFQATEDSDKRLVSHVESQVKLVVDYALRKGAVLVIAPITPPPLAFQTLPSAYIRSIEIINRTFGDLAEKFGYKFIDTRLILLDEDFIDVCCHLSGEGAAKVAIALNKLLSENDI